MVLQLPPQKQAPKITWEKLPDDFLLPDDPVENIQQPLLAAALTDALGAANRIQPEMLIASNFALVANVAQKTVVKAPDWLYVPQVFPIPENMIRRSYTQLLEGDAVAIVMEFLSSEDMGEYSVRPTFPYGKLHFYEQILKVPTYVIYDVLSSTLEVRCLQDGVYQLRTPSPEGRYWIPELDLAIGVWYGNRLGRTMHWLRWWDAEGNLLLWSAEQAEQEQQRAEEERQRAEEERQRAEEERQRAEEERQRAEEAIAQLTAEQQRNETLLARLIELGVDPNTLS